MYGDYEAADTSYRNALEIREAYSAEDAISDALVARTYYNIAENEIDMEEDSRAREDYEKCLDLYGPVAESLGDYHHAEYLARLSYYELLFEKDMSAALQDAEAAYELQPNSSFEQYIYVYALMAANDPLSVEYALSLIERGETEKANLRNDMIVLERFGFSNDCMDQIKEFLVAT
jgi:tetratricopeptide (TPR) repeat protein